MENKEGLIWYDGNLVDWKDAKLHVLTHGLHYASSVFEGERSYSGRIFKLHEHTERLLYSASELDFEIPYSIDEIKQASYLTLEKNNLVDAYIRPIAWRGGGPRLRQPPDRPTQGRSLSRDHGDGPPPGEPEHRHLPGR